MSEYLDNYTQTEADIEGAWTCFNLAPGSHEAPARANLFMLQAIARNLSVIADQMIEMNYQTREKR